MRRLFVFLVVALGLLSSTSASSAELVNVVRAFSKQYYGTLQVYPGSPVYSDRNYLFGKFPDCLRGSPYLQTPNRDKFSEGPKLVELQAIRPVMVIIGYDARYKTQPKWLEDGFELTRGKIQIVDQNRRSTLLTFNLWRSKAPKPANQRFTLGGNLAPDERANNGMYTAIFAPANLARNCLSN